MLLLLLRPLLPLQQLLQRYFLLTEVQLCKQGSHEPPILDALPAKVGERSLVAILGGDGLRNGDCGLKLVRFGEHNFLLSRLDSDNLKDLVWDVAQQEDEEWYLLQARGEQEKYVRVDRVVLDKVVHAASHQGVQGGRAGHPRRQQITY